MLDSSYVVITAILFIEMEHDVCERNYIKIDIEMEKKIKLLFSLQILLNAS